jgi:glycosyltransferase involved in cell wall biosynthesis
LGKYRELASSLKVDDMLLFHDRFVPTNEVSMWFSVCDWVVQPYIAATQSGITPMAIHFNKPTVVTRVGGLAESIHSKTGMVSEANPTALSQVLCNALANTKSFSDKEAFDMLREEKSWHRFCQLFSSTFIKK